MLYKIKKIFKENMTAPIQINSNATCLNTHQRPAYRAGEYALKTGGHYYNSHLRNE